MSLLIEVEALASMLGKDDVRIIDTRFSLQDVRLGHRQYLEGHIPGAIYADLEQDLSGTIVPGVTGRHPLPEPAHFASRLQGWGMTDCSQIVIYDDGSHAMAARCWWVLEWAGLTQVSILNGGFRAWAHANLPVDCDVVACARSDYQFQPMSERVVSADDVSALLCRSVALIDARERDRFAGRKEPIDSMAGHIPNAICAPFAENMGADGRFRTSEELLERFRTFYGEASSDRENTPVCYCGSGVTACHNIFAMRLAGLPWPRLYAGSWSEWITNKKRPIATGD